MADLLPGQFEMNGVVFGLGTDPISVLTDGWTKETYDIRSQDVPNPTGDTMLFGRDRLTPMKWTWDLILRDDVDVRPRASQLASAWRADSTRATPGKVLPLRYNENGKTYVVYGRPRELSWVPDGANDPTSRLAVATFQLSDLNVYSDEMSQLVLDLITTTSSAGLVLPAVLPWVLGQTAGATRKGIVTVGGTVATPLRITINGPASGSASDVVLSTSSWKVALTAPVASGDALVIDTATGTMTRNGSPYAGISRDSSLFLRVPPGGTEITLTANDPTSTLSATVAWRTADPLV